MNNCVEKKVVDWTLSGSGAMGASDDPSAKMINGVIPQGTSESERVGNKVYIWGYDITCDLSQTAAPACQVRVAVVLDTQSNGTNHDADQTARAKLVSEVWDVIGGVGGNNKDCMARRNLEYVKRYKVLQVKDVNLTAKGFDGTSTYLGAERTLRFRKQFKTGLHVTYDKTSGGAATNIQSNSIWLVYYAETGAQANLPVVARVRYTD